MFSTLQSLSIVATSATSERLLLLRRVATTDRRSARQMVDAIVSLEGTTTSSGRPIAIMITALPAPSARGIDLSLYPLPSSSATGKLRYIPSFRFRTRYIGSQINEMRRRVTEHHGP
nr:E3 ubiquitin-protein ligase WAVH1-like [Ipomoea batatas]